MNRSYLIGSLVILAFAIFGAGSFRKALTPYVTFEQARASREMVQVKGIVDQESCRVQSDRAELSFRMTGQDNDVLEVRYKGPKPPNFDQVPSVVAIGRYQDNAFVAERLLVKCPSKYQGKGSHPGLSKQ